MTRTAAQLKTDLRARVRQLHRQLPPFAPAWEQLRPLTERLPPDAVVLAYFALDHEPDPSGVSSISRNPLAVTRTPESGRRLSIHPWDSDTRLERHRFGFLQPVTGTRELPPEAIGLALVPGLAFDVSGGRLGRGAGYYDRLLQQLPAGVPLVGLTHSRLLLGSVPMLSHDVPMTHLLTEESLIVCGSNPQELFSSATP